MKPCAKTLYRVTMMVEFLIVLVLLLVLAVLIVLLQQSGKLGKISLDQEAVKGAMATCWKELGVDQDIGAIKERANDILQASQSLENLFRVTRGRGEYGEFQLEQILKDILPSQYVHIRERIDQIGKIPDAHVVTPQGIICIDSKFLLDNYRKMLEVFKSLPIDGWIAWVWESDSLPEEPGPQPGKGRNICANGTTGEGRSAYYELIRS